MCKLTEKAPYCDQSCRTRFAGMQLRMGNAVEGTFSNVKEFLNTVPKGIEGYRKFAADRQEKLEYTERLKKKVDEEKKKKYSEEKK
jgi:C4-type Zn-finger protein